MKKSIDTVTVIIISVSLTIVTGIFIALIFKTYSNRKNKINNNINNSSLKERAPVAVGNNNSSPNVNKTLKIKTTFA